jgi:hypothetical protein
LLFVYARAQLIAARNHYRAEAASTSKARVDLKVKQLVKAGVLPRAVAPPLRESVFGDFLFSEGKSRRNVTEVKRRFKVAEAAQALFSPSIAARHAVFVSLLSLPKGVIEELLDARDARAALRLLSSTLARIEHTSRCLSAALPDTDAFLTLTDATMLARALGTPAGGAVTGIAPVELRLGTVEGKQRAMIERANSRLRAAGHSALAFNLADPSSYSVTYALQKSWEAEVFRTAPAEAAAPTGEGASSSSSAAASQPRPPYRTALLRVTKLAAEHSASAHYGEQAAVEELVHLALDTEAERRTRLTELLALRGARPVAARPKSGYVELIDASTIVEGYVHKLSGLWPEEVVAKVRLLQFYDAANTGRVVGAERKKASKAIESYDKLISKGRRSFQESYAEVISFRNGERGFSRAGHNLFGMFFGGGDREDGY